MIMFKFRLEKVLRYRSMLVDAEALKLREIEQRQHQMQQQIINQGILIDHLILRMKKQKLIREQSPAGASCMVQ